MSPESSNKMWQNFKECLGLFISLDIAKLGKFVFLSALFRFSCNYWFWRVKLKLGQDFKSELIELFGALQKQKNYKNQKE